MPVTTQNRQSTAIETPALAIGGEGSPGRKLVVTVWQFMQERWLVLTVALLVSFVFAVLLALSVSHRDWGSYSVIRVIPATGELQNAESSQNELVSLATIARSHDVAQAVIEETGINCRPTLFHRCTLVKLRNDRPELLEFKLQWRERGEGRKLVEAWVRETVAVANHFDEERIQRTDMRLRLRSERLAAEKEKLYDEFAALEREGDDADLALQREELSLRQREANLRTARNKMDALTKRVSKVEKSNTWLANKQVLAPTSEALTDLQLAAYQLQRLDLDDVRSDSEVNRLLETLNIDELVSVAHTSLDDKLQEQLLQLSEERRRMAREQHEVWRKRLAILVTYIDLRQSQYQLAHRLFADIQDVEITHRQIQNRLDNRRALERIKEELAGVNARSLTHQVKLDEFSVAEHLEDRVQVVVPAYEMHYPLRSNRKKLFAVGFLFFTTLSITAIGLFHFTRTPKLPEVEIGENDVIVERSEVYGRDTDESREPANSASC